MTLAAIAAGHGKIDESILVKITRYDARGRFRWNADAIGGEVSTALVEAHETWTGSIGRDHIDPPIAIQVRH
jgi:hypothetical protein